MGHTDQIDPGWYPDPAGLARLRYWSGSRWTDWASDGATSVRLPLPRPARAAGALEDASEEASGFTAAQRTSLLGHLDFVERAFVPRALSEGAVGPEQARALTDLAATVRREIRGAPRPRITTAEPTPAGDPTAASPAGAARPLLAAGSSAAALAAIRPHAATALPAGPAELPRASGVVGSTRPSRWRVLRRRLGTELTVNGLAYLGVLLLFVGTFGLVAFAFGDVTPAMRPVAELVAASAGFVGAWILLRAGARVAGRAVEVLAGLVVPIMGITALVDGFPVPPDPAGAGLSVAATTVCLASAAGGWAWTRRHPDSGLRLTVAPTLWLAAATATLGAGRPVPQGEAVASVTSAQALALAVALLATTALAVARPGARLAPAFASVAAPGLVVIGVIVVATALVDAAPLLTLGSAAALVATGRLARSAVPPRVLDLAGPGVWVLAGVAAIHAGGDVVGGVGRGPIAVILAVGLVGLGELARRDARPQPAWVAVGAGLGLTGLLGLDTGAWAWVAPAIGLVWAAWRRPTAAAAVVPLGALAILAPLVLLRALAERPTTALVVAVVLAGASLAVVRTGLLATSTAAPDRFWTWWWRVACGVTGIAALGLGLGSAASPTSAPALRAWVEVAALLAVAAMLAAGPLATAWRPWAVLAAAVPAWHLVSLHAGVPVELRTLVLAIAAVGVAALGLRGRDAVPALSLTGAGTTLALWSLVSGTASGVTWSTVVGVAALVAVALLVALATDGGRGPVGAATAASRLAPLPWALTLSLLVTAVALVLRLLDALGPDHVWLTAVPASATVALAALARLPRLPRLLLRALAPVACLAAVLALLIGGVSSTGPVTADAGTWPAIAALAAVALLPLLLPAARRPVVAVWAAWAAVPGLAWLLLVQLAGVAEVALAAWTLAGTAAVYLVGAAATHRLAGGTTPSSWPARPTWVLPPSTVGGVAAVAALVTCPTLPQQHGGWVAALLALALSAFGALLGAGAWLGAGLVLGWSTTLALASGELTHRPWLASLVTLAVTGTGLALERASGGRPRWARWDVALAPTALLAGASSLALSVLSADDDRALAVAITSATAMGATAWSLTRASSHAAAPATRLSPLGVAWEVLGGLGATGLVLAAAMMEGWWPTAAVAMVAAVHAARSLLAQGRRRTGYRVVAALGLLLALVLALGRTGVTSRGQVLVLAALAVVTAAAILVLQRSRGAAGLLMPVAAFSLGATATGLVISVQPAPGGWPPLALLSVLLAAAAVQVACLGLALRRFGLVVLAPVLACAAWLALARVVGLEDLQWYTAAIGLVLLVVAELERTRDGDRAGGVGDTGTRATDPGTSTGPARSALGALELLGVAFLLVGPVVQSVSDSPLHALVGAAIGVVIGLWGIATRVRRRVRTGVVAVLGFLGALVLIPLAQVLPSLGSAGLWIAIAAVGLVAVLVAALLERGRRAVRGGFTRLWGDDPRWE